MFVWVSQSEQVWDCSYEYGHWVRQKKNKCTTSRACFLVCQFLSTELGSQLAGSVSSRGSLANITRLKILAHRQKQGKEAVELFTEFEGSLLAKDAGELPIATGRPLLRAGELRREHRDSYVCALAWPSGSVLHSPWLWSLPARHSRWGLSQSRHSHPQGARWSCWSAVPHHKRRWPSHKATVHTSSLSLLQLE